jgi:hypothetical protein
MPCRRVGAVHRITTRRFEKRTSTAALHHIDDENRAKAAIGELALFAIVRDGRSMTKVATKLDGGKRPIVSYHSIKCHRAADGIFGGIAKIVKYPSI